LGWLVGALAWLTVTLVAIGEVPPEAAAGIATGELPLRLTWTAPAGCPDLATERAEIRRRVGEVDQAQAAKPISAQVEIRATSPGAFRLSLRTRVGESIGERELTGSDCHQLADAAALVLALLVNPNASPNASPNPEPPTPPTLSPPAPPVTTSFAPRTGSGCGIDGVLAGGVLPGLAGGLGVRIFHQSGHLAAAARAGGFFAKEKPAAMLPGATASFYRLESTVQLCAATLADRRLGAALCLGGALVRLHGDSSGVSSPGQATSYWPEALLEALGHLRLTSATRLHIAAEARGLGSRPDFAILGLGSVYRPAAFSLRGALGLDVLF
jgi:hypothetical protein